MSDFEEKDSFRILALVFYSHKARWKTNAKATRLRGATDFGTDTDWLLHVSKFIASSRA